MRAGLGVLIVGMGFALQGVAGEACDGFKWDVRPERALYAREATLLDAGLRGAAAPLLRTGRLYRLALERQSKVAFPIAPGKQMTRDDTYGGLAALRVLSSGDHRIAVDVPLWIDVVADGRLIAPVDYQSQEGCNTPRKIVVFPLQGGRRVMLQISGSTQPSIAVTVLRARP